MDRTCQVCGEWTPATSHCGRATLPQEAQPGDNWRPEPQAGYGPSNASSWCEKHHSVECECDKTPTSSGVFKRPDDPGWGDDMGKSPGWLR